MVIDFAVSCEFFYGVIKKVKKTHLSRLVLDTPQHSEIAYSGASRLKRRLESRRSVADLLD